MKNFQSIVMIILFSVTSVFSQEKEILEKYGITVNTLQEGLKEGEKAYTFKAKDQNGETFDLKKALKKGPVVLNFYRGSWCPYCTKHLKNVQDSLSLIEATGATFIAVTPELAEGNLELAKKKGFTFDIVEDSKLEIMNGYKVTFDVNEGYQEMLKKYERDLTKINAIKRATLPIPATYIISQDGTILKRHYDPNYKVRMSVKETLSVLENI
ncbi:AhpC/TSA family protein [Flammeovirga sp. MY04]|uniref:peroxiredoxin-like family protein n=1 Tax=Flammeovirga sp. MY04 TaxID=1191459 RepID=UPI0008240EBA|nr:peroxiredoxin-like family protein [Flammeovirga sp. MY04]ANQ51937.2 AhpC/TSA family protein [Flammeovirga sp. MY04]